MMRMLGRPAVTRIAQLGWVPNPWAYQMPEARALLVRYEDALQAAETIPQWAVSQPLFDAYTEAQEKAVVIEEFLNPAVFRVDAIQFPGAIKDLRVALETFEPMVEETIILVREQSQPPGGVSLPFPPPPGTVPGTPSDPPGTAPAPGAVVGPDGTIVSESTFVKDVLPLGIGLAAVGGALLLLGS